MSDQSIQQQLAQINQAIAAQEALRGTMSAEQIEEAVAQLRKKKAELEAALPDTPGTSYQAEVEGGGAIAQGPGSTAVGQRGVNVGGSVSGNVVTGDSNTVSQVGGDQVQGDQITAGDISDSSVAMGRGAQAQQGISGAELDAIFRPVYQKIEARPADPDVDKEEIVETVQKIEQETAAPQPNETKLARWMRTLADMAPDIVDVMAASLGGPVSGATAVLKKVIDRARNG